MRVYISNLYSIRNVNMIKSQSKNVQVQYVYICRLFLIFDQTRMAQEHKYLRYR